MWLPRHVVDRAVAAALEEDLGAAGDVTSDATVPEEARAQGAIVARQPGRIAGLQLAEAAFRVLDANVEFEVARPDGSDAAVGDTVARLAGQARAVLAAERTALNFLGRLSGIATLTAAYVSAVEGTAAQICCTRKTTPGLRALEKYAVRAGGGVNHRFGLYDAILIKDNHIAAAGGLDAAVARAIARVGHMTTIEVEVDTLDQLRAALTHPIDAVLLDNMDVGTLAEAVRLVDGRVVTEASGGVTLDTVRGIAEAGVDLISVGALTHSARTLDLALDLPG